VTYNTDHPAPWGWRVSSYFLTKGIAAGIVVALVMISLFGSGLDSAWARWGAPLTAGVFLALTGVLLVADLKRPDRFYYLLTKGNPGSWLVRGAWILGAYAGVLGLWFLAGLFDYGSASTILTWVALPLGLATAGYTAYLFAQAEARDLWQSPKMLWHMLAGAFACGGAISLVAVAIGFADDSDLSVYVWTMLIGVGALGVIAAMEYFGHHRTNNARAAAHHLTRGRFAQEWLIGGQIVGVMVPLILGLVGLATGSVAVAAIGGIAAMAGIWFADDALVKAGQAVPLS
jgi:Ni/Fe-hydrogenase subunit HybB-like protein